MVFSLFNGDCTTRSNSAWSTKKQKEKMGSPFMPEASVHGRGWRFRKKVCSVRMAQLSGHRNSFVFGMEAILPHKSRLSSSHLRAITTTSFKYVKIGMELHQRINVGGWIRSPFWEGTLQGGWKGGEGRRRS